MSVIGSSNHHIQPPSLANTAVSSSPKPPQPAQAQAPQSDPIDLLELVKYMNKGSRKGENLLRDFNSQLKTMSSNVLSHTYDELSQLIDRLGSLSGDNKEAQYLDEAVSLQRRVHNAMMGRFDTNLAIKNKQGAAQPKVKLF